MRFVYHNVVKRARLRNRLIVKAVIHDRQLLRLKCLILNSTHLLHMNLCADGVARLVWLGHQVTFRLTTSMYPKVDTVYKNHPNARKSRIDKTCSIWLLEFTHGPSATCCVSQKAKRFPWKSINGRRCSSDAHFDLYSGACSWGHNVTSLAQNFGH